MIKKLIISLGLIYLSTSNIAAMDLDHIVITATRMAQYQYQVTSDVTVVNQNDIQASSARSVPDILEQQLGVNIFNYGTPKSSNLDIRGFGTTSSRNVLVLINDRRINTIDNAAADLIQVPLESVERIEILRGASSVLYGDNAVGGVVNIITKKGDGKLSGRVGVQSGRFEEIGTDVEISGEKHGVDYYLYTRYHDEEGYRKNSNVLNKDFNSRLGYQFTDLAAVDLNFGWHEDKVGLPGGLSGAELESLGRLGSADPGDFSTTDDRNFNIGLDLKPWTEDSEFGRLMLDYYYRDREVFDTFDAFDFKTNRNIVTHGFTAKYVFDQPVFNRDVNFIAGIDYYEHENDILGGGSNTSNLTISKEEFGAYTFGQFELVEDVYINAGTRYHQADYEFDQRDASAFTENDGDEWVSTAGIKYQYADNSNMHLSYQESFRFLTTDEWYNSFSAILNTGLEHQRGKQLELGIHHSINDDVVVSVTPYWIDMSHEIFFDPATFSNTNYPDTTRYGVEIGSEINLLGFFQSEYMDQFELALYYTHQRPEFDGGVNDGYDIPMVPRHQFNQKLSLAFWENFHLSLLGRYVGERYSINDTLNAVPPVKAYYTVDAKLAYRNKDFEFYLALLNMFDEQYYSLASKSAFSSNRDFFPAPGSSYQVGMNWFF